MHAHADQGLLPYQIAISRAAQGEPLTFALIEYVRYDSNFFKLPDGVDPPDSTRRSAFTYTTGVGLSFDKTYGMQRFTVNTWAARDHYDPYDNLDYTSRSLNVAWDWKVTPFITGQLAFDYTQTPTDFADTRFLTSPNPHRVQVTSFNVDVGADASLHPRFVLYRAVDRTSSPTFQVASTESNGAEAALVYVFRSYNRVEGYANASRGKDLSATSDPALMVDPEFDQREFGARASWTYSGLTKGTAQLGYMKREYDTFAARDFNGPVGKVDVTYELTGKSQLRLDASRTRNATQTTFASYYVEDLATASVAYTATGKIVVRPSFSYRKQDYRGSVFAGSQGLVATTRTPYLQVDWAALRSLDLSFVVGRAERTGSTESQQYTDRYGSVFARFKF